MNINCFLLYKMIDLILTSQMDRSSRVSFLNAVVPRVLKMLRSEITSLSSMCQDSILFDMFILTNVS